MRSVAVTLANTREVKVTSGKPMETITSAPPTRLAKLKNSVITGTTASDDSSLGPTRKRTGLMPMVESASSSSFTCMVPISAAKALPERAASKMAVTSGPISRNITSPSMLGT